ncbi:MAG TPA: CopD family protein [Gammaproteobacteria bacterium]|jgi:putative copper export protein
MLAAPDLAWIACRALSIAAVLQAAGAVIFMRLFGERSDARGIAQLCAWAAGLGIVLTSVLQLLGPARMTASFDGVLDASLQTLYLYSDAGRAHGVRVAGLALVLIASLAPGRRLYLDVLGACTAVASFALMGHTVTHEPRWLLTGLLLVHVAIIAFWFGSLLPLRWLARSQSPKTAAGIVEDFSKIAIWTVPAILAAGVGLAFVLVGTVENLFRPYGLLILAKSAVFAVLLGLASLNKWRFAPRIRAGSTAAVAAFGRTALAEWLLMLAVVAMTVVMTGLFSPEA